MVSTHTVALLSTTLTQPNLHACTCTRDENLSLLYLSFHAGRCEVNWQLPFPHLIAITVNMHSQYHQELMHCNDLAESTEKLNYMLAHPPRVIYECSCNSFFLATHQQSNNKVVKPCALCLCPKQFSQELAQKFCYETCYVQCFLLIKIFSWINQFVARKKELLSSTKLFSIQYEVTTAAPIRVTTAQGLIKYKSCMRPSGIHKLYFSPVGW